MAQLNFRDIWGYDIYTSNKEKIGNLDNVIVDNKTNTAFMLIQKWTKGREIADIATFLIVFPYAGSDLFKKKMMFPFTQVSTVDSQNKAIYLKPITQKIEQKLPEDYSFIRPESMPKIKLGTAQMLVKGTPICDSKGKKIGYISDYVIDTNTGKRTGITLQPNLMGKPKASFSIKARELTYKKIGMFMKRLCISKTKEELNLPSEFK